MHRETFSNFSDSKNVVIWPFSPLSPEFILLNVLILPPHGSLSSPALSFSHQIVASEQQRTFPTEQLLKTNDESKDKEEMLKEYLCI